MSGLERRDRTMDAAENDSQLVVEIVCGSRRNRTCMIGLGDAFHNGMVPARLMTRRPVRSLIHCESEI